jgi:rhomboid protease GluP
MANGSRVCSGCGALNGPSESRCYRCGRPFPGPVGLWLRQALGGELLATRALILACLIVFGLSMAADGTLPLAPEFGIGGRFRVSTWARFGALFPPLLGYAPWQLLSAVFFHFSVLHLAFNMMGLVAFGRELELRFGPARALLLFLAAGVLGYVASVGWSGAHGPPTGGASGGVFGQLGGVIGVAIVQRQKGWKELLVQNLVLALVMAVFFRVNTVAHLGGFVAGGLIGFGFAREGRRRWVSRVLGPVAVLGALASVGALVASMASPIWREIRAQEVMLES